ncbi:MAG: SLBB domain-containing protein [Planctomycetes bacterium]|nr:SLBB domain-containing protein [Planctomycetota bacterium]
MRRPANVRVPIGTPIRDLLAHCGGTVPETREFVMGGPMMGSALASIDVPVLKGTSGVLAFTRDETARGDEFSCLACGCCLDACANFLNPSILARLARAGDHDGLESHFVMDCMECGACSFSCPSNIPIVQLIRVAKSSIRDKKRKERKA